MPSPKGVPRPTASIAFLLASEPLPVSSRGPLTNLVVVAPDGTGVVKMLAVVHPCGPRPLANAYLVSGPGVLSLDRARRGGGVARVLVGGISRVVLAHRTDTTPQRSRAESSVIDGRRAGSLVWEVEMMLSVGGSSAGDGLRRQNTWPLGAGTIFVVPQMMTNSLKSM